MEILNANEKHIPVINEIARKTWNITYSEILTADQIEYMLDWMYSPMSLKDQMNNQEHHFLLIKENEIYLGFVSFEINYLNTGKTKIHKLYVLPQQHKKGIGAKLVEEVVKRAIAHENHAIQLNMNKNNEAIHFYNKMGFKIAEEGCFDIGNGFFMDDYILEKDLKI